MRLLHGRVAFSDVGIQLDLVDYVRARCAHIGVLAMADVPMKFSDEQRSILRIALTHLEQSQRRSIAKYAQTGRQAMVDALEKERAKIAGCLAALG